jgi:hypothetical protein
MILVFASPALKRWANEFRRYAADTGALSAGTLSAGTLYAGTLSAANLYATNLYATNFRLRTLARIIHESIECHPEGGRRMKRQARFWPDASAVRAEGYAFPTLWRQHTISWLIPKPVQRLSAWVGEPYDVDVAVGTRSFTPLAATSAA